MFKQNNTPIVVEIICYKKHDTDEILSKVNDSFKKITNLYKGAGSFPEKIQVFLATSREEFDKAAGFKSQKNNGGFYLKTKVITFHPNYYKDLVDNNSCFEKTLTHELSHLFTRYLFNDYLVWATEGVAQYVANQLNLCKIDPKNLEHFLANNLCFNDSYNEFLNHQGYAISKQLVLWVAKNKGDGGLLKLLSISTATDNVGEKLSNIFGTTINDLEQEVSRILSDN